MSSDGLQAVAHVNHGRDLGLPDRQIAIEVSSAPQVGSNRGRTTCRRRGVRNRHPMWTSDPTPTRWGVFPARRSRDRSFLRQSTRWRPSTSSSSHLPTHAAASAGLSVDGSSRRRRDVSSIAMNLRSTPIISAPRSARAPRARRSPGTAAPRPARRSEAEGRSAPDAEVGAGCRRR